MVLPLLLAGVTSAGRAAGSWESTGNVITSSAVGLGVGVGALLGFMYAVMQRPECGYTGGFNLLVKADAKRRARDRAAPSPRAGARSPTSFRIDDRPHAPECPLLGLSPCESIHAFCSESSSARSL